MSKSKHQRLTSRLESINIEGFQSLQDIDIELKDINVLVGVNGAGKSNLMA